MIAPGQQRRARRRAHRGRVKAVVGHAGLADALEGGCVDLTAEGGRQPRAGIVDQDYEDVWRALSQTALRRLWTVHGLLHGSVGDTARWLGRERQYLLRHARAGRRNHQKDRLTANSSAF